MAASVARSPSQQQSSVQLLYHQHKQRLLWEDLFFNPWEWWDNRLSKNSPSSPDFRHKISGEGLWIICNHHHEHPNPSGPHHHLQQQQQQQCKPLWVDSRLPSLDFSRQAQELQDRDEEEQLQRSLHGFSCMDRFGSVPPDHIYLSLLKACSKAKSLGHTRHVHAHLLCHNVELAGFLGEHLVLALAKCNAVEDAYDVLLSLPQCTVFTWTAIISGYTDCGLGQEALKMYNCMQEDGIEPNRHTFVSLLKACVHLSDLKQAKKLHDDVLRIGVDSDVFVASTLVSMYGKLGSIVEAEMVFSTPSFRRDIVSWNAMLIAYVDGGCQEKALLLFRQMTAEGINPDQQTIVATLQACCGLFEKQELDIQPVQVMCLDVGRALHSYACKIRVILNHFVVSSLISIYGKCGSIMEAEYTFNGLYFHDVVSWCTMLSVYMDGGQEAKVLWLYKRMLEEGVGPDQATFVIILQACGALLEKQDCFPALVQPGMQIPLEIGQAVRDDVQRNGFNTDKCVSSALVAMYGKCGKIGEAQNVFNEIACADIIAWNAILSALVGQSEREKALQVYRQMQWEGIIPNQQSLVLALQACGGLVPREDALCKEGELTKLECLQIGRALHVDILSKGLMADDFVGSSLLTMYSKCGSIEIAESLFNIMLHRNSVCWNAMLSAYADDAQVEKALQSYRQLSEEGISPSNHILATALVTCGDILEKDKSPSAQNFLLDVGRGLHGDVRRFGLTSDLHVGSTLVSMYGKFGNIIEAENSFDGLAEPDAIAWTEMLSTYTEEHQVEQALRLYSQMQEEGIRPTQQAFVVILQACGALASKEESIMEEGRLVKSMSLDIGRAVHVDVQRLGFGLDISVGSTLVSMYGKCGSLVNAEEVFHGLRERDVVVWNAMLSACLEHGQGEKALHFYSQMQEERVAVDNITITSVLQACIEVGSLWLCGHLHSICVFAGYDCDPVVACTLIRVYGSCSSMADALAIFDELTQPNVVSWNACMAGYAQVGSSLTSFQMFQEMQLEGIKPDGVTFLSLLSACNHMGFVNEGIEYFRYMSQVYAITPSSEHHVTMMDTFGRAGDLNMAGIALPGMPMQATLTGWLCLLGACYTHGLAELGKHAFDLARASQVNSTAPYVLMSNIYAASELQT